MTRSRFCRRSLLAAALAMVAGSVSLLPFTAHAYSSCRSDPVLSLSSGAQLALYEDIYDAPSDVTGITYVVHIPVGTTVTGIAYSGAIPVDLQSVTWKADENPGNYDAYTTVYTAASSWMVTAYMSGTVNSTTSLSTHTNGHTNQTLHSHLHF